MPERVPDLAAAVKALARGTLFVLRLNHSRGRRDAVDVGRLAALAQIIEADRVEISGRVCDALVADGRLETQNSAGPVTVRADDVAVAVFRVLYGYANAVLG